MSDENVSPLQHLIEVLRLGTPSDYRNHTYLNGESLYFPTGRVYGGQVIAQSLIAAARTVPEGRLPHSIHGYFIAAGDIHQDLLFDVESLRDGRSFSARRVNVTQAEGAILTAIASFQEAGQAGVEFSDPMPADLPDPESLTSAKELMAPFAGKSPFADYYAQRSPFDIRHITPTVMLRPDRESADADSGRQMVWMKADGHADVPQEMHRAMLALGCDQVMMEPVLRRAGLSIATPGISYASIDHSMWWYRDVDINDWHLYVQDTPTAAHGRGLGTAKVYSRSGELVAVMAQEAMIRVPDPTMASKSKTDKSKAAKPTDKTAGTAAPARGAATQA
ncbi:thioesterase family protein [Bifidobacterium pullorum subsp. saeculare]|uniref:Thioesterase family protein n=1 Tax=Bifidobacterium pullorum subsp. saeculare TaxID=78257 RepID=A0A939BA54_9BIFI|nr:thioesterase family protein [Bifidobacterium pullorum subsp. saeculare]